MSILGSILFLLSLSTLFGELFGLASISSSPKQPSRRVSVSGVHLQQQEASDNNGERTVVLLFHKPPNVVTSHRCEDARTTVYDEVENMKGFVVTSSSSSDNTTTTTTSTSTSTSTNSAGSSSSSLEQATGIRSKLHAIGRLDADTTGLLLLTNDGGLVHHVTNPNAPTHNSAQDAISKTYEALIMGHHDEASLESLWQGVDIGAKYGGMTQPVHALSILDHPTRKSTVVSLTICEGKNRQVRRMFHALGSGVMKLKRTHIGHDLTLDGVEQGQWRLLSDQEIRDSLSWEPKRIAEEVAAAAAAGKKKKTVVPRRDRSTQPPSPSKSSNRRRKRRGSH
jgi:pseudouridine synthase